MLKRERIMIDLVLKTSIDSISNNKTFSERISIQIKYSECFLVECMQEQVQDFILAVKELIWMIYWEEWWEVQPWMDAQGDSKVSKTQFSKSLIWTVDILECREDLLEPHLHLVPIWAVGLIEEDLNNKLESK